MSRHSKRSTHSVRNQPSSPRLPKSAQRLLTRLHQQGATPHAGNDADTLIARDLAARRADGMLDISAAGRSHLARLELARTGAIDPFLGQHLGIARGEIQSPQGRVAVALDTGESPLGWLASRKTRDGRALIEPAQLQAGERLRADFTCAHLMPRVTSNWTAAITQERHGGGSLTYSDAVVAARQRVQRALDTVGPEFSGLLVDVCCFLKGLADVERERNWPPRSAKIVLQLGLDRLARHYGYGSEARGAPHAQVRTWLAPDAAIVSGQ